MNPRISIDTDLIDEVQRLTGANGATYAVEQALRAFIARHHQRGLLALFGKFSWDEDYDYKRERTRRRASSSARSRRAGLPRRSPKP